MSAFRFLETTPELIRANARSCAEALHLAGLSGLEDALLPADFVANFAERAAGRPGWIGYWVIDEASGYAIGSCGYKAAPVDGMVEIGYGVHPDFEGRGAATAMCLHATLEAFQKGATVVRAHTLPENIASQKVLIKSGFAYIGERETQRMVSCGGLSAPLRLSR